MVRSAGPSGCFGLQRAAAAGSTPAESRGAGCVRDHAEARPAAKSYPPSSNAVAEEVIAGLIGAVVDAIPMNRSHAFTIVIVHLTAVKSIVVRDASVALTAVSVGHGADRISSFQAADDIHKPWQRGMLPRFDVQESSCVFYITHIRCSHCQTTSRHNGCRSTRNAGSENTVQSGGGSRRSGGMRMGLYSRM